MNRIELVRDGPGGEEKREGILYVNRAQMCSSSVWQAYLVGQERMAG